MAGDDPSSEDRDDAVLLDLLLDHSPAQFATSELVDALSWPTPRVEDALARLARAGLAHRQGAFAFATRPAVRCRELGV